VRPSFNSESASLSDPETGFFGVETLDAALPEQNIASGAIHEFIPATPADFPAALGFMLCLLQRAAHLDTKSDTPILWCHILGHADFPSLPYLPGLSMGGTSAPRFLTVSTRLEKDMLWALEEGLSMTKSPLIVGVNARSEKIYDFTASRRLSLRAARNNCRLFLLRPHTAAAGSEQGSSTTAATRWQISPRPSRAVTYKNAHTPTMGLPTWQVNLTRCKGGKTGNWILEWDHETFSFRLASSLVNRKPPARPQPAAGDKFFASTSPGRRTGS